MEGEALAISCASSLLQSGLMCLCKEVCEQLIIMMKVIKCKAEKQVDTQEEAISFITVSTAISLLLPLFPDMSCTKQ